MAETEVAINKIEKEVNRIVEKPKEEKKEKEVEGYDLDWIDEEADIQKLRFTSFVKDYPHLKKLLLSYHEKPETLNEINERLGQYGEQPELLDPHLTEIVALVIKPVSKVLHSGQYLKEKYLEENHVLTLGFTIIHKLVCVRGYKTIVSLFPHDVHDLEPVLNCLTAYPKDG
eukprot:UN23894